ncbi:MAG: hypothetical protein SFX18_11940 [Pirellulales bacterium]|nr:hypothetical protein [Pirellulales bacterium]
MDSAQLAAVVLNPGFADLLGSLVGQIAVEVGLQRYGQMIDNSVFGSASQARSHTVGPFLQLGQNRSGGFFGPATGGNFPYSPLGVSVFGGIG